MVAFRAATGEAARAPQPIERSSSAGYGTGGANTTGTGASGKQALEVVVGAEDIARQRVAHVLEALGADLGLALAGPAHVHQFDGDAEGFVVGLQLQLARQLAVNRKSRAPRLAEVGARLHLHGVVGF